MCVCVCVCVCVCGVCVCVCVCVCVYAVCVCVYCRCTASDCWSALPPHGVGGKTLNLCVLYLLWLVSIFTFDMCSAPQSLTIYRVALFYSLVPTPKVYMINTGQYRGFPQGHRTQTVCAYFRRWLRRSLLPYRPLQKSRFS